MSENTLRENLVEATSRLAAVEGILRSGREVCVPVLQGLLKEAEERTSKAIAQLRVHRERQLAAGVFYLVKYMSEQPSGSVLSSILAENVGGKAEVDAALALLQQITR